jgi:hypothetical protein
MAMRPGCQIHQAQCKGVCHLASQPGFEKHVRHQGRLECRFRRLRELLPQRVDLKVPGTVMHGRFSLERQEFMAMDSNREHAFPSTTSFHCTWIARRRTRWMSCGRNSPPEGKRAKAADCRTSTECPGRSCPLSCELLGHKDPVERKRSCEPCSRCASWTSRPCRRRPAESHRFWGTTVSAAIVEPPDYRALRATTTRSAAAAESLGSFP